MDNHKEILKQNEDMLIELLRVSPNEINLVQTKIKDMENALKTKRRDKNLALSSVDEISVMLDTLYEIAETTRYEDRKLEDIITVLENEKEYYEDQAKRTHVEREENKLKECRKRFRMLMLKRKLADGITKRSDR